MSTYTVKAGEIERRWWVVDADGATLGRLSTRIASALRGKHKAAFTDHLDVGDAVVVVNAAKVRVTGKKLQDKEYARHSGYPGGFRTETLASLLERRPEEVIRRAVRGMLPRNRLGEKMIRKLYIYAGPEHPHAAQRPEPMPASAKERATA
jgi:large subunit ribosomal protein L13